MTATLRTTPGKKRIIIYFTLEFCNCLDLFIAPIGLRTFPQAKYIMSAFNAKRKYDKLAAVVHVTQITQNLVISGCFAENRQEMYKDI